MPEPASSDNAPQALRCKGLVKRYQDVVAVNGLDLEVNSGECFGLLGPNGAGKTTTVEILEGLTSPNGGEVEVLGRRWGQGRDSDLRARLGVQLQETQFPEKLTVEEVVRLFRSFFQRGQAIDDVIRTVELEEKRGARVGKLSGGQKQRLALACALVGDPELLFLDEPTTGLDPQARMQVWALVEDFHRRGITVVLTTHYMEEAARLCDRVAIMDHGKVMTLGSPSELVQSLGADQVIEFSINGEMERSELGGLPGVTRVIMKNHDFLLHVANTAETIPALLGKLTQRGLKLDTMTTHQATLEDVFIKLTGRKLRDG
jgi:ABC-2 type transport system ATP-binding protein